MIYVSKGVTRKIEVLAKDRDCGELKEWLQSISNHLYWCASSSAPGEEMVAKWTSLINHVQNVHVHDNPSFPTCEHAEHAGTSKWLKPGKPLPPCVSPRPTSLSLSLSLSYGSNPLEASEHL